MEMILNGKPIDFETTVLDKSDHFAEAIIVKGHARFYAFPPNSKISRIADFIIVRGYGGVFVYERGNVSVRKLGEQTLLDFEGLPMDDDSAILAAIEDSRSKPRPAGDVCPDCTVPVVVES